MIYQWSLEQPLGYLNTWLAVKLCKARESRNPLEQILPELRAGWGECSARQVSFKVLFRLGKNT